MTIRNIEPSSAGAVAKLMSTIKPDWWDFEGADQQLQDVGLLAKLVGWYLEEDGAPKGWLLCAEYEGYSCLTIENLGYDEDGAFVMEKPLEPLLRRADHLLMSRTIEARTPYLHGALAQRAGRLQRIVGDTAKAPLVALLEQREKRWQAQPKRHFRLPFERWPQALGEMRRHLAERLPALHDLGLEGLDAPSVAALPGDQLFTLTTLSLWQQEYGASL